MKHTKINEKFSENFKNIPKSFIREILNIAGSEKMISFAGGLPNPDFFPVEALKKSALEAFDTNGVEMLQYAGTRGYLPLRQWIADRYNKKYRLSVKAKNIIITNGSQQAIDVLSKMFVNPGDGVLVEKPTYLGGIQALSAYSPRFYETKLEKDGPDIIETGRVFDQNDVKLMYAIPNFQNPSGITYSEEKRKQIAALLEYHNVLMLEDDPYNEICFDENCEMPVYAYAPKHVFWTGSFSKMIAPGLRMGWVVIPDGYAEYFERAKQSVDLHSNNLSQYVVYQYLTNNYIDRHLIIIRKAYARQCTFMQQLIEKYLPHDVQFTKPRGGMFLWLKLPDRIDACKLVERTLKQNVVFVPGVSFYVSPNGKSNVRMNFSNASEKKMEEGIRIIASELKEMLQRVNGVSH
ncbi:MAG: PLP-dependent aminotransferase family protein [Prolixibacteraceae bacterium]|jgi:2-aminoadipate transaminase|nr:PLP-dependent aminotransferase family protein [Prolixibacteraceae bacterium]